MGVLFSGQITYKPGFVEDDHLSSSTVTDRIKRVSTCRRTASYLLGADLLAAGRVYLLRVSPRDAVGSYPTHFTLTIAGGFVSVALSLGLPPVAVSDCRILSCPDFPLTFKASGRLANCLFLL